MERAFINETGLPFTPPRIITISPIHAIDSQLIDIPPPPPQVSPSSPFTPKSSKRFLSNGSSNGPTSTAASPRSSCSPRFRPTNILIPAPKPSFSFYSKMANRNYRLPNATNLVDNEDTFYPPNPNPAITNNITSIPNNMQLISLPSQQPPPPLASHSYAAQEVEEVEEEDQVYHPYALSPGFYSDYDSDEDKDPLVILPTFFTPSHVNLVYSMNNLNLPNIFIPEERTKTPRTPKTPKASELVFNSTSSSRRIIRSPSDEMLLTNAHRSPSEIIRGKQKAQAHLLRGCQFQL